MTDSALDIQAKPENKPQLKNSRLRTWSRTATLSFVVVLLLAGGVQTNQLGFSQEQSAAKFDVEARRKDLLRHLNAVIQFYRNSTAPIQSIGEPNDVVYRDQAATLATQATQLAFQSAKAEADLMAQYQQREGTDISQSSAPESQQRFQTSANNAEKRIDDLKTREAALDKRIASASPRERDILQAERKQLDAALDLANAMKDALGKIVSLSDKKGQTGLAGDIDSLERSVPQIATKTPPVAPELASLDEARSSGVSSQTIALFQLLGVRHSLDSLAQDNDDLHKQAQDLRAPISGLIRNLLGHGQQLSEQAVEMADTPVSKASINQSTATANAQDLKSVTSAFKAISAASVPLSQEIIALEQSQANLTAWHTAVDREYKSIFRALLLRLLVIAIALGVIFAGGELWTRTTNKYVREPRRRRQLLIMRRTVVGFLSAIVLLFGFVTQFNSLATFAGFITAGVAVGLQTILLSVAAYFFIIGRYGIKVGDRITILTSTGKPVTGDVIEVGLVRFYMMELAGNGTELNPTGRVSVFSNAVLFQAGAPIYKQIPGTEYAWHEITVKLSESANYKTASEEILKVVRSVYESYRSTIEQQHHDIEKWMHTSIKNPETESRLLFEGGSLQLWARFPVQIKFAAETDEKLTEALLQLLTKNPEVKEAVSSLPVIQATVKG